jgi:hypothetical protein
MYKYAIKVINTNTSIFKVNVLPNEKNLKEAGTSKEYAKLKYFPQTYKGNCYNIKT